MLSSLVHNPCEVTIFLYSSDIFLHPPANADLPGRDKTLHGLVEVRAPSERTINGIRVSFQGMQTIAVPQKLSGDSTSTVTRYENKPLLEKIIEISRDDRRRSVPNTQGAAMGSFAAEKAASVAQNPALASSATTATVNGADINGKGKAQAVENEAGIAQSNGIHLEKGIHGFEFAFIIPASLPPFERSKYGRVRYTLTATVLGGGRGRSNISTSREIFIISQVEPDGGPVQLDMQYNNAHEALGAMSISLTSASLTVGGAATLSVYHPSPPPGLNVHVIRAYVEQTTQLWSTTLKQWMKLTPEKLRIWERGYHPYRSPERQVDPRATMGDSFWIASEDGQGPGRPGRSITDSAAAPTLAPFGWSALASEPSSALQQPAATGHDTVAGATGSGGALLGSASGAPENGYRLKAVVRLPDDNTMRPSTVRGSRVDIKISHDIGVEVYFSRVSVLDERKESETKGKPKIQLFSMRRPILIQSCCATFDHIHLPPYSLESPMSSRPPSPTSGAIPISSGGASGQGGTGAMRTRPGPPSRTSSQTDFDHWTLKQTLKAALGGHASSPGGTGVNSSGLRSGDRSNPSSQPVSRPSSRPSSPTRHNGSGVGSYFGRRSRPSSPTRGQSSHEGSGAHTHAHSQTSSLSTSPASGIHHPIPRRGHGGLHALTPSNRGSPHVAPTASNAAGSTVGAAAATTTPGTSPRTSAFALPIQQHTHAGSYHSTSTGTTFPTVVTSPSAGSSSSPMALGATPRSLPPNTPWALGGFPERTPTSHDTCQCGKTTEELIEAEHRLLEGAPTAPGMWVSTHDDDEEPPPWMPSRPVSPDMSSAMAAASLYENGSSTGPSRPYDASSPDEPGIPGYTHSTTDVGPASQSAQNVSGWYRGANGVREGGRRRGKIAEAYPSEEHISDANDRRMR